MHCWILKCAFIVDASILLLFLCFVSHANSSFYVQTNGNFWAELPSDKLIKLCVYHSRGGSIYPKSESLNIMHLNTAPTTLEWTSTVVLWHSFSQVSGHFSGHYDPSIVVTLSVFPYYTDMSWCNLHIVAHSLPIWWVFCSHLGCLDNLILICSSKIW